MTDFSKSQTWKKKHLWETPRCVKKMQFNKSDICFLQVGNDDVHINRNKFNHRTYRHFGLSLDFTCLFIFRGITKKSNMCAIVEIFSGGLFLGIWLRKVVWFEEDWPKDHQFAASPIGPCTPTSPTAFLEGLERYAK